MIKSFKSTHYRGSASIYYEFGPGVTIVTGPNGAGKTSLLEAMALPLRALACYLAEEEPPMHTSGDFITRGQEGCILNLEWEDKVHYLAAFKRHLITGKAINGAGDYPLCSAMRGLAKKLKEGGAPFPVLAYYQQHRHIARYSPTKVQYEPSWAYRGGFQREMDFPAAFAWFESFISAQARWWVKTGRDMQQEAGRDLTQGEQDHLDELADQEFPNVNPTLERLKLAMQGRDVWMEKQEITAGLPFNMLPDSEQITLGMCLDIARRLCVANDGYQWPEGQCSLDGPGVVLVDAVDKFLDATRRDRFLGDLATIFPGVQFIVTATEAMPGGRVMDIGAETSEEAEA